MNPRIEASAGVGGRLGKHAGSHHATGSLGVATFPWGTQRCLGGQSDPGASHRCVRLFFLRTRSPKGASQVALVVKNLPANAGDIRDTGPIPGSGRSPGGGHSNLPQYSCLENPHGQRSLVSYSPWDHQESDTTEVTENTHIFR